MVMNIKSRTNFNTQTQSNKLKTTTNPKCITNQNLALKNTVKDLKNNINQISFNYNGKYLPNIPASPYVRKNYIYERILLTKALEDKSSGNKREFYSKLQSKLNAIKSFDEAKFNAKIEKTKQEIQAIKDGTLKIEDWQASEHHYKTPEYKLKVLLSIKSARELDMSSQEDLKQKIPSSDNVSIHFLSKNNFAEENSIEIVDNKVVIKNPEYKINQTLNLTYDQFNHLFPKNTDYKKVTQQDIPDCYLVSALQTILNNPESFAKYLKIFSSDDSGNIFITIPLTKLKIQFPKDKDNKPKLFNTLQNLKLEGALGNQMFEQAYALNRIKMFSDALISKTSNENMKKDFELFMNNKFNKLTQGEDIFDDVLLELAILNKKYTKEIETLYSSDYSIYFNLNKNLSAYLSIREQLKNSIDDNLLDVLCDLESPENKRVKDAFPFLTEETDVNSIINNYIKFVNNINNLFKDEDLSLSEYYLLRNIVYLVQTKQNAIPNIGFSTILKSGNPLEVYSTFLDDTNTFIGTFNRKYPFDIDHFDPKGISIKSYKSEKASLLDNHSINNLISLSLIDFSENHDQYNISFIDPKNKFDYDHTYSIYCVDNKSKEVYLTDPNKPDWSQILPYNETIENIGFYYNELKDNEDSNLNQAKQTKSSTQSKKTDTVFKYILDKLAKKLFNR